jgi:DNA-directed RNA polymerase specialized sigma24 family protein
VQFQADLSASVPLTGSAEESTQPSLQRLAAVEQILPMAVWHGSRLLGDPAVITNLLEDAAAIVSRRLQSQCSLADRQQIHNVPAYLLTCFKRKVNRAKRKEVVTVSLDETVRPEAAGVNPAAQFDLKILADEYLARCDFITIDMYWRRVEGYSWEEIGKTYEMSAHAAEKRFSQAFQQVRAKLKI